MEIPDNYSLWEAHDREQQEWLKRRPRCADCDHEIQDEFAYYINGEWICEECMSSYKREVLDE